MKTVGIFYFSGTGNTEIVANKVREEFAGLGYQVELRRIEDILKNGEDVNPRKYDLIGIGCPVIGYGVPKLVRSFIGRLPKMNHEIEPIGQKVAGRNGRYGRKTFIFRTAGGVAPINYNASKAMIRSLARRGYTVFHERVFSIGSNWIVKFEDAIVRQLHEATLRKVSLMCSAVAKGEPRLLQTGIGLKIKMELANKLFSGFFRIVGKDLVVGKSCTDCGLCIKNCPSRNITRKNGKIRFGLSCNSCMRCVYSCPGSAIRFRVLSFFPVSGGYDIRKTLCERSGADQSGNCKTPPFFSEYIRNDAL